MRMNASQISPASDLALSFSSFGYQVSVSSMYSFIFSGEKAAAIKLRLLQMKHIPVDIAMRCLFQYNYFTDAKYSGCVITVTVL